MKKYIISIGIFKSYYIIQRNFSLENECLTNINEFASVINFLELKDLEKNISILIKNKIKFAKGKFIH